MAGNSDTEVRRMLAEMLLDAFHSDATEIHLECLEHEIRLRFCVEGRWRPAPQAPPKDRQGAILRRLKRMAGLHQHLSEPAEGCIRVYMASRNVDILASAYPTAFGESWFMELVEYPL